MFSEWNDPYNIDEYYGDINALMKEASGATSSAASSTKAIAGSISVVSPTVANLPMSAPETPTGVIVNSAPAVVPDVNKNKFTIDPSFMYSDDPSPRKPEPYHNRSNISGSELDWISIIMFIAFVFLVAMLIQARSEAANARMTIQMLMAMYQKNTLAAA